MRLIILLYLITISLPVSSQALINNQEEIKLFEEMIQLGALNESEGNTKKFRLMQQNDYHEKNLKEAARNIASVHPSLTPQKIIRIKNPPLTLEID